MDHRWESGLSISVQAQERLQTLCGMIDYCKRCCDSGSSCFLSAQDARTSLGAAANEIASSVSECRTLAQMPAHRDAIRTKEGYSTLIAPRKERSGHAAYASAPSSTAKAGLWAECSGTGGARLPAEEAHTIYEERSS